jgi:hypothetical protein
VSDDLLNAVRRFSERCLPSRGWSRALVVGDADTAILLAERGYRVTVAERDDAALQALRRRLEAQELEASFATTDGLERLGEFDVVVSRDPALAARLRKGGLLFGAPGSGAAVTDFGADVPVSRAPGRLGRLFRR